MIEDNRSARRARLWAWAGIAVIALVAAWAAVLAVSSIQVGLAHPLQRGAWMPILAGIFTLVVLLACVLGAVRLLLAITRARTRLPF